ncbi:M23 family metallopeptidase [Parapedobacter koreensis]|nr:M23 family metallopeptidase [Parapedobacter koreensis]
MIKKGGALTKQKKRLAKALNVRYKVVILQEETFEEKASFTGKLWYWITGASSAAVVLIIFTIVFIRATPLREYVMGMSLNGFERSRLIEAYTRIDSMEQAAQANTIYLTNLQQVIGGQVGETLEQAAGQQAAGKATNAVIPATADIGLSKDELALRELVESGAPYDLPENPGNTSTGISSYTFYSPIKGIISSSFSAKEQHYAVDIAVKLNEPVRATLSGNVVFASYTPETGYVAIVQHSNNLLSLYKHCASIIKKVGSFVRGGEVIAFAGDTGELSTGPHLHFELWYNGNPVNPTDYIAF